MFRYGMPQRIGSGKLDFSAALCRHGSSRNNTTWPNNIVRILESLQTSDCSLSQTLDVESINQPIPGKFAFGTSRCFMPPFESNVRSCAARPILN